VIEIPAGEECGKCQFVYAFCALFDEKGSDGKEQELGYSHNSCFRCSACLAAYPHGATVRIEAKEEKP
jgi:ferredoxin